MQRDQYLSVQGITFTRAGHERPLPIDLVPRVIEAAEWRTVERGIFSGGASRAIDVKVTMTRQAR